jgi:hypothetical protein
MNEKQLVSDSIINNQLRIVSYHVEERINMNFGSSVTTYDVSSLSLISTTDLGQNNTRIITPKYAKVPAKRNANVAVTMNSQSLKMAVNPMIIAETPIKIASITPEKKWKYVDIDIIGTYERVMDKGYTSVDMLKRVGNSRFFGGDLTIAAKWYSKLFALTTDLEPEYYYRYAQTLTSIKQTEKANEMMQLFESKNL